MLHEPLTDVQWNAERVHSALRAIAAEARSSLFTGGIGAALYAADCLDARARFPIVDGLDTA